MSSNVREELNSTFSSISLSDEMVSAEEDMEEDEEDEEIKRMLSEHVLPYQMVGSLPPTPRPMTRASSMSSIISIPTPQKQKSGTSRPVPVPCKNFRASRQPGTKKVTKKESCKESSKKANDCKTEKLLMNDDSCSPQKLDSKENVEKVVQELIAGVPNIESQSPEPKKRKQKKVKVKASKETLEKRWVDLNFTADRRCSGLKEDVQKIRKTKEAIDALIKVLEKTKEKLVKEDETLTFTKPPCRPKVKKEPKTYL